MRAEDGADSLTGHHPQHALRLRCQADNGAAAGGRGDARRRELGGHTPRPPLRALGTRVHLP